MVAWLRTHRRELVDRALAGLGTGAEPDGVREAQLRWIVDYNVGLFTRLLDDPGLELDEAVAADLVCCRTTSAGWR